MDQQRKDHDKIEKTPATSSQDKIETDKTGQRIGGLDKNGLKEVDYYESDRNPKA